MKKTPLVTLLGSALLITACGTAPTPADPIKPFMDQKLDWAQCSPTILGSDSSKDFARLKDRLKCAEVMVPLDWKNPSHGKAYMSLIRVTAADSNKRQGAIFFNPGGPGGDGLAFAPYYAIAWGDANKETATGAALNDLAAQFDLIGFSPRGTGDSTRIYCGSNQLLDPIDPNDQSDANIKMMIEQGRLIAKTCKKNPVTPFINTEATVQDLNLTRQLLGEKKLNYVGYSYGTWLGSWYAKRFPESTGRILLDGNMDWSGNMEDTFKLQPRAFERDWRDVVTPYFARLNPLLGLGTDGAAIYKRQQAMTRPMKDVLAGLIVQLMYARDNYPVLGIVTKVAYRLDDLIKANPKATAPELAAALQREKLFEDPALNDRAMQLAMYLLTQWDAQVNAQPEPLEISASTSTFLAVTCNDTPWTTDLETWKKIDAENIKTYPLLGGGAVGNPCLFWGGPSVQKPATPSTMPPVLMLQNEFDPATATEGAMKAFASVKTNRLIYIDNEPQHAAYPYDTECVDLPISRYFLTGVLPRESRTDCQALPLPGEKQVYPVNLSTQALGGAGVSARTFQSQAAQRAMASSRDILVRNALPHGSVLPDALLEDLRSALQNH